jgi:uncharacterized protein YbjT (DUF2867 family)
MTILILGATGNIGSEVVDVLASDGHAVRAVSRSGTSSNPSAEAIAADLNDASTLIPLLDGVTAIFSLAGYDSLAALLEAAVASGVERFVLLSSSGVPHGLEHNPVVGYHRVSENLVRASGIAFTMIRPNSFMSNTSRWFKGLREEGVVREPFPKTPIAVIDPADIAAVASIALTTPQLEGQALRLSGPEALTPAERLAVLNDELGHSYELVPVDPDEVRVYLASTAGERYADAFIEIDAVVDETTVQPDVSRVLGREPGSYREWVRRHREQLERELA